jgi:2-oxoisovalerate dehydrogenase E2 component (dihydrolipoyl transacylase)
VAEAVPSADLEPDERRSPASARRATSPRTNAAAAGAAGEWRAEPRRRPALRGRPRRQRQKVLTTPAVRARARDLGIDLSQVQYSGDRIRHAISTPISCTMAEVPASAAAARERRTRTSSVGLRRRIAENMQEAKRRIPHFTYVEEVNVTALEQTRAMMNLDRGSNPKLTMLPS